MTMNNEDNELFVTNARNTLVEAQVLCEEASMRIVDAKGELSKWQQDISKLRFMISCLKNQGAFLYKNILKGGIGENLIKTEWSQVMLVDLIKTMQYSQDQISDRVTQLNNITNILVSGDNTKDVQLNLGDFIPKENTHILEERLKEIPIIKQQIENITSQYNNMTKKVGEQLISTRIKTVEDAFDKSFGPKCPEIKKLSIGYSEEMDNLEHELVEYMNSLTDHFDKCKLLQSKKLEDPSYQELFEVVTKDDRELGSILETLKDTIHDVDLVIQNFQNMLDDKTTNKVTIHNQIKKLINEFHKHQEYLMIFKDISDLIFTFKESCLQEVKLTKELCEFYQNFKMSYHNLLKEVERRRSVAQEMTIVLKECQKKLQALHTQDQKAREDFLRENANYLPETIWPGKIDDLTPLYSLDYKIKDI